MVTFPVTRFAKTGFFLNFTFMVKKKRKTNVKTRLQKTRKVIQTRSKRRRRKPSPANSKAKNQRRKKSSKLVSKSRKSVKRTPKRKRKGVKNLRVSNKVQKVSRVKKQQRGTKKVHKRVPAKQVRKVRKPSAYVAFKDDKGEKKLYKIDLRQFKTFKEKRSYITRYNFWPMITEAENYIETQFPFGFMVIIQTRFKGMELDMAGKLSDIEAAIDDPNMRESVLNEMDSFRTKQIEHPQLQNIQTRSDQLFKPNNIKAIIIRFLYRTNK